jgi:ketosteroid isomerase-like protein
VSPNKELVETYLTSIGKLDWVGVAACLANDVERIEWAHGFPASGVPVRGKAAVLKDLDAPQKFQLRSIRLTEENDVVVSETEVRVPLKDGGTFVGRSCGVFELESGKLKRISSWVAEDRNRV